MSTIVVLGVIAVVQTMLSHPMLVTFLLGRRVYDRAPLRSAGRDALVVPVRDWLIADGSVEAVVRGLAALPSAAAVDTRRTSSAATCRRRNAQNSRTHFVTRAGSGARSRRRGHAGGGGASRPRAQSRSWAPSRIVTQCGCCSTTTSRRSRSRRWIACRAWPNAALVGTVLDRYAALPQMVRHYLEYAERDAANSSSPSWLRDSARARRPSRLRRQVALAAALVSRPAIAAATGLSGHESDVVRAAVADALRRVPNDATLFTLSVCCARRQRGAIRERAAASTRVSRVAARTADAAGVHARCVVDGPAPQRARSRKLVESGRLARPMRSPGEDDPYVAERRRPW